MRRVLPAFLLLVLVIPSIATSETEDTMFSRGILVPMNVLIDGKQSGADLVVNFTVFGSGRNWMVNWKMVKIWQDWSTKKIVLYPHVLSSSNGDIKNIVVREDSALFDLVTERGAARVVVTKGDNLWGPPPKVKVNLIYFDSLSKKTVTEEWVATDKIVLPSTELHTGRIGEK